MARILIFSPFEPPADGIAKHTANFVEAWDSAGNTVLVVSAGKENNLGVGERLGREARVSRILKVVPRRQISKEVAAYEPDIVIVQFAIAALNLNIWTVRSLCRIFRVSGTPVVVAYHEPAREFNLLGPVTRFIYRSMARITDVPVVFSAAGRNALIECGLFDSVVEVPHGTAGVTTVLRTDIDRVKRQYGLEFPLVLSVGFTSHDKGTDILLNSAAEITSRRSGDVQFLIAGSPRKRRGLFLLFGQQDAKFHLQLQNQASAMPNVNITFTDYVAEEDIAALLSVADVVVLPYRRITQSGIANLALSCGSVLVCSDLVGLRSDLGDAALYVPVGDSAELANQISNLLSDESHKVREQMRQLSLSRASARTFDWIADTVLHAGLTQRNFGATEQDG